MGMKLTRVSEWERGLVLHSQLNHAMAWAEQIHIAEEIVRVAKDKVHKKTHMMEGALGYEVIEEGLIDVGVVGDPPPVGASHAPVGKYAVALEFGHVDRGGNDVPAFPFMRPAITEAIATLDVEVSGSQL